MDKSLTIETIISTKREIVPDHFSKKSDESVIRNMFGIQEEKVHSGAGAGAGAGQSLTDRELIPRALNNDGSELTMANIRSSSYIAGWEISTNDSRLVYKSRGYQQGETHNRFREKKPIRKGIVKKNKKHLSILKPSISIPPSTPISQIQFN